MQEEILSCVLSYISVLFILKGKSLLAIPKKMFRVAILQWKSC